MFHLYIKINDSSYSIGTVFMSPSWIEDKILAFKTIKKYDKNYEICFSVRLAEPMVNKDINDPDNFFNYVLDKLSNNLNHGTVELFSNDKGSINSEEYCIEGTITIIKLDKHILQFSVKPESLEIKIT